jgi:hypothetical protein
VQCHSHIAAYGKRNRHYLLSIIVGIIRGRVLAISTIAINDINRVTCIHCWNQQYELAISTYGIVDVNKTCLHIVETNIGVLGLLRSRRIGDIKNSIWIVDSNNTNLSIIRIVDVSIAGIVLRNYIWDILKMGKAPNFRRLVNCILCIVLLNKSFANCNSE